MKNTLAIAAGIISFISAFPYLLDTLKGKTHPNLVTWITWSMLNGLSTLAALSAGAPQTALLSGAATIGTGAIVLAGLKNGVKRYTRFDIICQGLALAGLVLWKLTNDPNTAVALAIGVIIIAAIPTWHHAWVAPRAETWEGFAMGGVAAILTFASLTDFTFASLAYPTMFLCNSILMTSIILGRRRQLAA